MRISDWSSDVCSSDLSSETFLVSLMNCGSVSSLVTMSQVKPHAIVTTPTTLPRITLRAEPCEFRTDGRSEEHTSELQSLMRISYAVFCLKKKNTTRTYEQTRLDTPMNTSIAY